MKSPFPENISQSKAMDSLTLISLNMVHGRGKNPLNPLLSRKTAEANLLMIALMLGREKPDIVALQEADTLSFWNGSFDHVRFLASAMNFPLYISGHQIQGLGLLYGTALMSRLPAENGSSVTFSTSLLTLPKGYVKATIAWPGDPAVNVDLVSVHLDFMKASVRLEQVDEMVRMGFKDPLIIMGDFNCEWNDTESAVKRLAEKLNLKAYKPCQENLITYPGTKRRLDWILISPSLRFESYEIVPDILSDHLAVKVVISKK